MPVRVGSEADVNMRVDEPRKDRASVGRDDQCVIEDGVGIGPDPRDDAGLPENRLSRHRIGPGPIQQCCPGNCYSCHG